MEQAELLAFTAEGNWQLLILRGKFSGPSMEALPPRSEHAGDSGKSSAMAPSAFATGEGRLSRNFVN